MKHFSKYLLFIIIIGILLALKFIFLSPDNPKIAVSKTKANAVNVHVQVIKLEKSDSKIYATGSVIANESVDLKAEASGKITRLSFKEGSHVNKGDILLKINDSDLRAQLEKINLSLKLAKEKESRLKKLLSVGGISKEDYDIALNQLQSLEADKNLILAQIAKTEIIAPFSGTIGLKSISEGSYISPSITIASLQQTDPVKIDFSIPEKYSSIVQNGDSIHFTLSESQQVFGAKIFAIEPRIDLNTRTLQIRAICNNRKGKIYPGSFARIELILKRSLNTIMIPTESIIPILKGQKVFIVKNGTAQSRKVMTGLRTDSSIEIISGLESGDTLITSGLLQVKQDGPVKIIKQKN